MSASAFLTKRFARSDAPSTISPACVLDLDLLEVDDLPVLLEGGVGEAAVRKAPIKGHLAALEARIGLAA